jgi:hypothetical protein
MNRTRKDSWLIVSFVCDEFAHFLRDTVQGLALVDHRLYIDDVRFESLNDNEKCTDKESIEFFYRRTISYLWVLGAYEALRVMDQRAKQCTAISNDSKIAITHLKNKFSRLRMPLAKLEAARKNPSGWNVAWPTSTLDGSIAWQISKETRISRIELSDEMLSLFIKLHAELKDKMPFSL